ncbi:hypothetical protein KA005_47880 [bacterium]|nr:hypothetical protein [bacterium]
MKSAPNKWKDYLWEGVIVYSFELGSTIGHLNSLAKKVRIKFNKVYVLPPRQEFKQQLPELLAPKLKKMPDVTMEPQVFGKLTNEMVKLFSCSLASSRTPDEIILGLQSDAEMRNEVVELLISRIKTNTSLDSQRTFLHRILSGDDDLRALLNKQKEKKGFPHTI